MDGFLHGLHAGLSRRPFRSALSLNILAATPGKSTIASFLDLSFPTSMLYISYMGSFKTHIGLHHPPCLSVHSLTLPLSLPSLPVLAKLSPAPLGICIYHSLSPSLKVTFHVALHNYMRSSSWSLLTFHYSNYLHSNYCLVLLFNWTSDVFLTMWYPWA